jgi:hypothetical protein
LAKKISIDQINARLSGGGGYNPPPSHGGGPEDEEGTSMGLGSIALVVAMFIGIGGGTFWFMGGDFGTNISVAGFFDWGKARREAALAYESEVQDQCGKSWIKDQDNTDEMHCFMTTNIIRLCKTEEREHLVAMIEIFHDQYNAAMIEEKKATFKTIGKIQSQSMQLGLEAAKLEQMSQSSDKKSAEAWSKQFDKVTGIVDNAQKPMMDVLHGQKTNKLNYKALEADFANLVERGLISESEFRHKPTFVRKGLAQAKAVKNRCTS